MATHLFFYGVLLEQVAQWPFLAGLGPGQPATTRGTIYAIADPNGCFPALLPGEGIVHGALHEAGQVDLAAVDAFEGADYRRAPIMVEAAGAQIEAHAYLWNSELPAQAEPITNGDFARWLRATGQAPFSGR